MNTTQWIRVGLASALLGGAVLKAEPAEKKGLAMQAADAFIQVFGGHPGFRLAHAKGIVVTGTFEPTKEAAELSKAAHFKSGPIQVVARFSDGTGIPQIPDGDPHGNPKGFAIRFNLPNGENTDIVANGLNGFVAGTPEDFVGFISSVAATKPDSPKPTPVEQFLGSHPASLKYVTQPNPTPVSFATQAYYGNNAFIFVNAEGKKQAFRYQILPVAGETHLEAPDAAKKPANFLMDEIKERIGKAPVAFRLIAQLAAPDDPTADATKVWPADRKQMELGTIKLSAVDPKSDQTQKELEFTPTNLTDGIQLSDDPLPAFRAKVYRISVEHRQ